MHPTSRIFDPLLALLGIAGLIAFLSLYKTAFPQAAVTLEVTRDEALSSANTFLEEKGAASERLKQGIQFEGNTIALLFLQRTLGLDEASRWARDEVPIWSWRIRWFEPEEREEWQLRIGLDGTMVGMAHVLEESAAGADLEQDSALALAEAFVAEQQWDLGDFERVEASSEKLDNRTDHHFAWQQLGSTIAWQEDDPEAGTGSVRVSVDVAGDEVVGYRQFLRVPEDFSRDLEQIQSIGQLLAIASLSLTLLLVLAAMGISIARAKRDTVRWAPALSIAGVVAVLTIASGLTAWPAFKFAYPTGFAWSAWIGVWLFGMLFGAVLYGLWVLFATSGGETLGRETFPKTLEGFTEAARGHLLTPAMARASINGYALGFFLLGYLTVFYVLARTFLGAWLPAEGPYSEVFNTALPFIAPLTIGVIAATSEEITYRLFAVSLFKRYLKYTPIALLIPAMIWAFGHSNYAIFPVYIRGIELTIAGLIFGIGFLRFGVLTCIVAHFVIDAVLLGTPLLTSGNSAYVVSGIVVMGIALLPAVLGLAAKKRKPEAVT